MYYTYSPSSYFPALYGGGAMAGPRYRYDASNPSPTKFPAWFDGRRFLFDWTQNWVQTTDFDGQTPVGLTRFASAFTFSKPMDMTFGPDGSLYVLEYGNGWGSSNDDSGIYRIDYVEGNRKPVVHQTASTNSGTLPLKVDFDASDSTDPDGDALSYAWDFDGDGTTDATTAHASHTYTTAGTFTPRVTVTDAHGAASVGNLTVVAGNTRPTVSFVTPVDGTFSEFGDPIPFKLAVVDPEDGTIDCTKIRVTYSLGHNEHAHQQDEAVVKGDCTGVLTPARDSGHAGTAYVYHVLQAFYTDGGGAGGTPALTGEAGTVLHPRGYAAETYPKGDGVGLYVGKLFAGGSGDWFMFPRINLEDTKILRTQLYQYGTGATVTVRADSPTGPVVARFADLPSMPARTGFGLPTFEWFTAPITDPGGVHDLYFVIEWPEGTTPEVFVGNFEFLERVSTETPGTVGGTVPATLAVSLGAPATFGTFTPGVAREYTASTTATVTSTAADATLSVSDPSANAPGHLVNGAFALPRPLEGLGQVKTWTEPVSNDQVPVQFTQAIGAGDALRTGAYSKTLTFTLSTTTP